MRETFVGFDSAWADKEPGGVCFATLEGNRLVDYGCPEPAYFDHAKSVIERCSSHTQHYTLIAIDQPTMVPNWTGMRPVERVAGSVKQGVQPAYRGKESMFGPSAPIWAFLDSLQASEQPEEAQRASEGLHLIEVYPGLALSAFFDSKADDLPLSVHYNPAKQYTDWQRVAEAVAMQANRLRLAPFADWANSMSKESDPEKTDQDCLDALICLIVACKWRRQDPDMLVVGDWRGYMVTPLSLAGKSKVMHRGEEGNVPVGCGSWDVYESVLDYFAGKHYDAFEWLGNPSPALNGKSPLQWAENPERTQDVLDLIGRLEHGIPT